MRDLSTTRAPQVALRLERHVMAVSEPVVVPPTARRPYRDQRFGRIRVSGTHVYLRQSRVPMLQRVWLECLPADTTSSVELDVAGTVVVLLDDTLPAAVAQPAAPVADHVRTVLSSLGPDAVDRLAAYAATVIRLHGMHICVGDTGLITIGRPAPAGADPAADLRAALARAEQECTELRARLARHLDPRPAGSA